MPINETPNGAESTSERSGRTRRALHLEHLIPGEERAPEEILGIGAEIITALAEFRVGCCAVQFSVNVDGAGTTPDRLDVHVLTESETDGHDGVEVGAGTGELLDLFDPAGRLWELRPVDDGGELERVFRPVDPVHLAAVARQETLMPWERGTLSPGFTGTTGAEALWVRWPFGPPSQHLDTLAGVLLNLTGSTAVRVCLRPTWLSVDEREALRHLLGEYAKPAAPGTVPIERATGLDDLLFTRPLFDMRITVASPSPISTALLCAVGNTVSAPLRHDRQPSLSYEGGYSILRAGRGADTRLLLNGYETAGSPEPLPSAAPRPLVRLRSLFDPWEAAHALRLPVRSTRAFPGVPDTPVPRFMTPGVTPTTSGPMIGRTADRAGRPVRISRSDRFRHTYVQGQTGTGKSSLLSNLALTDIGNGDGVVIVDPHGDLIDQLIGRIPEHRIDDVILVDPADPDAVVGLNLLEADSPIQHAYLLPELGNMFQKLFDPNHQGMVGERFKQIFANCARLLIANPGQPASLLDVPVPYSDPAVRERLLHGVTDPTLLRFWKGIVATNRSADHGEVIAWMDSKFGSFTNSDQVRRIVGQARSTFSFSDALANRRIVLVKLSKGLLGEANASLIGYVVLMKLWAAALERASVAESDRPDVFVYIDEFHNITGDALPDMLAEARKFRLSVTLANQFFTQIPEMTRDALLGNVGGRITFRLGPRDADPFAKWFGGDISASELTRLPNFTAITSLSHQGVPLGPAVVETDPPVGTEDRARAARVRARSNEQWARPVDEVDDEFTRRWAHVEGSFAAPARKPKRPSVRGTEIDNWLRQRAAS